MEPTSSRITPSQAWVPAIARRWFPGTFAAAVFGLTLVVMTAFLAWQPGDPFYLEIKLATDQPIDLRVCFDRGSGFHDDDGETVKVDATEDCAVVNFQAAGWRIKGLRLQPQGAPFAMRVCAMTLRRSERVWTRPRTYYTFDLKSLRAVQDVTDFAYADDGVRIAAAAENSAPTCAMTLPRPVIVGVDWWHFGFRFLVAAGVWLGLWIAAAEISRSCRGGWLGRAAAWVRGRSRGRALWRPSARKAVWLVAVATTVLSCYPVIFCGKSFASADFLDGTFQLYYNFPTLPGEPAEPQMENGEGTDLGPMAWQNGPYSVVQSRALFRDGELPLWDRYDACGLPLLGQGQSMFGDPLEFLPILAGGTAWSWDAKFVLAKLLFAAGAGLLVLAATECLPAALLLCFSSAFIGFFSYRLNHPAYFSLCYAPWILLTWVEIVRAPSWRRAMAWGVGLILANWVEMNSGTAKEAYMLVFCLNLTGLVLLFMDGQPLGAKSRRFLGLLGAGLIFGLMAAPVLLAFFDTLRKSATGYDSPHAFQLQPSLFIGLFDDIFYRQLSTTEAKVDPAANFLVLFGTLISLAAFQRLIADRKFSAVFVSMLVPLALVFGVVPSSLIRVTPFLGNIYHIDNTFSCVLLIQLFVIAGFGLKYCLTQADRAIWRRDLLTAALIGAVLISGYFGFLHAAHRSDIGFLKPDQQIPVSSFFCWYVPSLVLALLPLPFALRRWRSRGPEFATILLLSCSLFLLHWRNGLQVHTQFFAYTPVLPNRTDWFARSPAVDYLHADRTSPYRVFGIGANFYYGYGMLADIETITGVDALGSPYLEALEVAASALSKQTFTERIDLKHIAACKPFHDLLNIRYFVVTSGDTRITAPEDGTDPIPGLSLAAKLDLDLYRNDTAWPRAFFVDRLASHRGADEFAASVLANDGRPFASFDADDLPAQSELAGRFAGAPADRTVVEASEYRLTNSRTSFTIDAPRAGVVVLTEVYYPGDILADINGHRAPVFRVNQAFRGIMLDGPGHYRISFTYRPPHFVLALWASALGLGLFTAAGWWFLPVRRETFSASSASIE